MESYTVKQLAKRAGVSVRTLHHYDHIGLLQPAIRTGAGYRVYGREEWQRLQQILFFKELDFPLQQIAAILDDPDFDRLQALQNHRQLLQERLGKIHSLIETIDKSIDEAQGGIMLSVEEMYQGFTIEQRESIRQDAQNRWGEDEIRASEERLSQLSAARWTAIKQEGDDINRALSIKVGQDPADPEVQALIARHHSWIKHFWTPDAQSYQALGQSYVSHPDFKAFYEKLAPGMAEFVCEAIGFYCQDFPRG